MRKSNKVSARRSERIDAVRRELRAVRTRSILFSEAVAKRLSINATDLVCGDILLIEGAMTAGRLAEMAGVTTGAMTGIVRHLEAAGHVVRKQDPGDARKVVVAPARHRASEVEELFKPLNEAIDTLCEPYSDGELKLIADFENRVADMLRRRATLMRIGES